MGWNEKALVIAHRGFRGIAPENTLAAARAAVAAGADWWELDVAASADGELVVIHDDTLSRTTDARSRFPSRSPWSVYDFSLAELKSLDAGSWYGSTDPFGQIRAGRVKAADLAAFKGERIPTLREALEFTKSTAMGVDVEIKDAGGRPCDAWIAERVVGLVRELGMADLVLISSFNKEYLDRIRKAEPGIRIGVLVDRAAHDPVALLDSRGAVSYNPGLGTFTEAQVSALRSAGRDIFVWTVNEESDMKRLLGWGVTGIFTDFPDRLLHVLGRD